MDYARTQEGSYIPLYDTHRIHLIGLPFKIENIELDNTQVTLENVQYDDKTCTLIVPKIFTELHISGNADNL